MSLLSSLDDSHWMFTGSILSGSPLAKTGTKLAILDPLTNEHLQMLIGDILRATPVDNYDIFRWEKRLIVNVDIVGVVRSFYQREKFFSAEVDDGTGCLRCTIWRNHQMPTVVPSDSPTSDCRTLCDQLFRLARCSNLSVGSSLEIYPELGRMVHLRGRLKCFRGELNLSAHFCRFIADTNELLMHLVYRDQLRREVYSLQHDPQLMANRLAESQRMFSAKLVVSEACKILAEDGLHTFTKLDLCLNNRLIEAMRSDLVSMSFCDSVEPVTFVELKNMDSRKSSSLQSLADSLIHCLSSDGWIYPASEPVGSMPAYHTVLGDPKIPERICAIIRDSSNTENSGVSAALILQQLRRNNESDCSRITVAALYRLLDVLETESRVYQAGIRCYKLA